VTAATDLSRYVERLLVLFREHACDLAAPLAVIDEELVREHIETLLLLALNIDAAQRSMAAAESALSGHRRDRLDRSRHVDQQRGELPLLRVTMLDEKLRQRRPTRVQAHGLLLLTIR
jgi:hypothetical protein